MACKHNFQFSHHTGFRQNYGYRSLRVVSTNHYFCTKCLEQKEVTQDETFNQTERERLPNWALEITQNAQDHASYN